MSRSVRAALGMNGLVNSLNGFSTLVLFVVREEATTGERKGCGDDGKEEEQ